MDTLAPVFEGWSRVTLADGAGLIHPAGGDTARIRIREAQPLRPLRALLAEILAEDHRGVARVGPAERFATADGEDGGLVVAELLEPPGAELALALVVGEGSCLVVHATRARGAAVRSARDLALLVATELGMGLGQGRRRRYDHDAPAGWTRLVRPRTLVYLHPEYPRREVLLTVHDTFARCGASGDDVYRRMLIDAAGPSTSPSQPEVVRHDLVGQFARYDTVGLEGRPLVLAKATVADAAHVYRVDLESPAELLDEELPGLHAVLRSIRRVPTARPRLTTPIQHWVE